MAPPWIVGAVVVSVAASGVASAKILACPPGRFEMGEGALAGSILRLAERGMVEIEDTCTAARAEGRYLSIGWHGRFRIRWAACESGSVSLRARVDDDCRGLRGVMRTSTGGRRPFTAARVPMCGDGVVSPGEACDDAKTEAGDCCVACQAEPGCYIPCDRTADCAPQAVCERHDDACRATTGICRPRHRDECRADGFAVCGCDGNPYASECDAWAAGVTTQGGDGLNFPVGRRCWCRPDAGRSCSAGRMCEMPYRCSGFLRPRLGGICIDPPDECDGVPDAPVCGCDGTTYRNDCERQRARVQKSCVCSGDTGPAVPGARCGSSAAAHYGCDCSGTL